MTRLRGTPPGVVEACSGPSGAPPVAPVVPWLSSRGASQYRTRSLTPGPRGSCCSIPSRRWYLLEIVEACLHGEGLSMFSRGFLMYLRQVGVVPILSCMKNIELWCVGAA